MYGSYSKSLHAWSQSRIIENTHTENGKGGRGFDSGSESSSPSLLPKLCPDNTASLYPDIKTSPGLLLERKVPPLPPRVTITSMNFHAEQLRQLSMQDSKRPHEDWVGWVVPAGGWNSDPSSGWGWTDIPERKNISPKQWCRGQGENLLPVIIDNKCCQENAGTVGLSPSPSL